MTLDELPLMLTVDEAAEVLRIGRNGAYAAVAEGAIPSVRIGRVIRIPRAGLASLLDGAVPRQPLHEVELQTDVAAGHSGVDDGQHAALREHGR